jgi:hypothetical protein
VLDTHLPVRLYCVLGSVISVGLHSIEIVYCQPLEYNSHEPPLLWKFLSVCNNIDATARNTRFMQAVFVQCLCFCVESFNFCPLCRGRSHIASFCHSSSEPASKCIAYCRVVQLCRMNNFVSEFLGNLTLRRKRVFLQELVFCELPVNSCREYVPFFSLYILALSL